MSPEHRPKPRFALQRPDGTWFEDRDPRGAEIQMSWLKGRWTDLADKLVKTEQNRK